MIEYILFFVGIALLVKGADYLVDGSSALAKRFRVPPLVIGLTIVAFGTSLPELVVNVISAIKGYSDIAFGNIVGSNIANILLILGMGAIFMPIKLNISTITKEIPFSFLAAIVLLIFSVKSFNLTKGDALILTRADGLILLCFFVIFMYYILGMILGKKSALIEEEMEVHKHAPHVIFLMVIGGLVALYFGGKWTVNGAVAFAKLIGISSYFISATIIAVGTSLPELVTTIMAAIKKEADLAVGNVVGSNIFNIFFVLGITSTINPIVIPQKIIIDIIFLAFITFLFFIYVYLDKEHTLKRWEAISFLMLYVAYIIILIIRG